MSDEILHFDRLLARRCACPRCAAPELISGDLCRVFAGDSSAPTYDRTTRCETCGMVWIEQLVLASAYAIDLRDKRVRSATIIDLAIKSKAQPGGPPPGAVA